MNEPAIETESKTFEPTETAAAAVRNSRSRTSKARPNPTGAPAAATSAC